MRKLFILFFVLLSVLFSSFADASLSVTAKSRTFTNGTANDATAVDASFVDTYGNDQTISSYINNMQSGSLANDFTITMSGLDFNFHASASGTPSSNVLLNVLRGTSPTTSIRWNETNGYWDFTNNGTNFYPIAPLVVSTDPTGPSEGTIWYNTSTHSLKFYNGTVNQSVFSYPTNYHGSSAPVWSSSSSLAAMNVAERDSTDTYNINGTSLTPVFEGGSPLPGTIGTGGSSSTTITGSGTSFETDFQVGDVIHTVYNGTQRITAIASNTSLTVANAMTIANGTTYYYGFGPAPSTWYNMYAMLSSGSASVILSTRNIAGGDNFPATSLGFTPTAYRQLPFAILTDSNGNIIPFTVANGWPYRPKIMWNVPASYLTGSGPQGPGTTTVATTTSPSFVTTNASAYVPPISTICDLHYTSVGSYLEFRTTGTSNIIGAGFSNTSFTGYLPDFTLNSSQQFDLAGNNESSGVYIDVMGFVVTEVP